MRNRLLLPILIILGIAVLIGCANPNLTSQISDSQNKGTAVTSISLSKSSLNLVSGDAAINLTVDVQPALASNKKILWATTDTKVATVSQEGTVTPIAFGAATILAKADDGEIYQACQVSVDGGTLFATANSSSARWLSIDWSALWRRFFVPVYSLYGTGPAGGFIFYDAGNYDRGWRYIEAAPESIGGATWAPSDQIAIATSNVLGSGRSNTIQITASFGAGNYAAQVATNYRGGNKADWYLGSLDEMNALRLALGANNLGNSDSSRIYWTSTQVWQDSYVWQGISYKAKALAYNCGSYSYITYPNSWPINIYRNDMFVRPIRSF